MPASTIESTIAFFESLPREDTLATCWLDADRALSQGRSCVRFVQEVVATPDNLLAARIRVKGEPEQVAAIYTRLLPDGTDHLAACCTCDDTKHPCKHAMALAMALARRIRKHDTEFPEVDDADPRTSALAPVLASDAHAKARDAAIPGRANDDDGALEFEDYPLADRPPAKPFVTDVPPDAAADEDLAGLVGWDPETRKFDWDAILHPAIVASAVPSPEQKRIEEILNSIDDLFNEAKSKARRGEVDALCADIANIMARHNKALADSNKDAEVARRCRGFLFWMCKTVESTSWSALDRMRWLIRTDLLDENEDHSCAHMASLGWQPLPSSQLGTLAKELEQIMRDMGPLGADETRATLNVRTGAYSWLHDFYDDSGHGDDFFPRMIKHHRELGCTLDLADDLAADKTKGDDLRTVCIEGVGHLQGACPTVRSRLYHYLGDCAKGRMDDKLALAYDMETFMASPHLHESLAVMDSAADCKLKDEAFTALRRYFETGVRDQSALHLPELETGPAPERYQDDFPVHEGLVRLAIEDADALAKAYARWRTGDGHILGELDTLVAALLTEKHHSLTREILVRALEQLPPNIPKSRLGDVIICLQFLQLIHVKGSKMADWEALADRLASRTNNMRKLYAMRSSERPLS